ncbi:hypothetical protein DSO57_1001648 [Entomophthora muscae]|uniref:Uncharacterized protein n=1 Tax=Entomophthora muscae TaxID=34485 RepID=A0ACC2S090_9FUNG|nr:hypothetical protein DSO57_1001648 [Entomophthora muscae]
MPKMFNHKAHEKLDFVIQYLKQSQNPHAAILELDSRFKDRHLMDQEAILINNLFARTKLTVENEATQVKPFKNPNEVTVKTVEDTPAPPRSPNLKLVFNLPMKKINCQGPEGLDWFSSD